MKMRMKWVAAAAASAAAMGAVSPVSAQGLEYKGYVRTGTGGSTEGGKQVCFGLPGAGAKYRLGNECETYAESQFIMPFGKSDGTWAKYNLMLALVENNAASDYESSKGDKFDLASRQNYFEAGGFFGPGALQKASIWIGKRYYNRHDVHINDYYYWNNSGLGGGIEDIAVGSAKMAFSYHSKGDDTLVTDTVNGLNTSRFSARLYDLPVNPGGTLEFEAVAMKGTSAGNSSRGEGSGFLLFAEHKQTGIMGGFNKLALVLGKDAGAGDSSVNNYRDATDDIKGSSWRVVDQLYIAPSGSPWSAMATAGYSHVKLDNQPKTSWFTAGVRPQYQINNYFSIATELGYDRVKTDGKDTAHLTKLTVAPQVALAPGFWSRPVFRTFVTYAKWNDAANGAGTNGVFGSKTNGLTYGIQVEAWW
ncbi:carbohydrate porin [Aquincola tertiaricarbonis]|uniref:Carbohydrate porin n=1 Tax=Aquincola tertiaricarbonis TaxID=391953 RepID=A0ABY4S3L0_AQUTE|nr:carbohydrate porin [Aquincola tertiaricarbonis]URI06810.1 carbohydrate porin [Aquincola tertiaricarbonis]